MKKNPIEGQGLKWYRISRTTAIFVIAGALLISLVIIKPAAPERIVLLTGPEGSAYHEFGKRYAEILALQGLDAEVKITTGGLENIKILAAGIDDAIAFAPSNIEQAVDDSVDTEHLVSLGSVAWEPIWLFYRADIDFHGIQDLSGRKVATGAPGTVERFIAREILSNNGILEQVSFPSFDDQTPTTIATALLDGRIDAAFFLGPPAAQSIAALLRSDLVRYSSIERAAAYQARFPGVARIVIPEGVIDLGLNIPDEDLVLLSATTNLVTLDTFYPGTVPWVLRAVAEARDQRKFTTSQEVFPNDANASLPLKRAARRYYDQGEKGLARRLPYGVTRWLNHLGFVVLPLLFIAVLGIKVVPVVLKTWSRFKLLKILQRLEVVEKAHAAGADPEGLLADLDSIDRDSAKTFSTRSTVHDYIDIRGFMHDMRERVSNTEKNTGEPSDSC